MAELNERLLTDLLDRVKKLEEIKDVDYDKQLTYLSQWVEKLDQALISISGQIEGQHSCLIEKGILNKEDLEKHIAEALKRIIDSINRIVNEQRQKNAGQVVKDDSAAKDTNEETENENSVDKDGEGSGNLEP